MATSFQSPSLYVGDLIPEVTEAHLFELFREIGPVNSIRVCRDAVTRRSLGYAYVNFQNAADAERALDALNFRELKGRPIRIMWSQRDPSIRQSGIGNIFIKNLDKEIDIKSLHDTFSAFGNILSCKVACDENGESKGYGFVHFETQEAAQRAIEKLNGMLVSGKKVFVGPFIPRRSRVDATGAIEFTNVYIKNLPLSVTDEQLLQMFEEFGKVTSYMISRNAEGVSRGFGFANFDDPASAAAAVEHLHGKEIEGQVLYVARAQKKKERLAKLQKMYHDRRLEQASKYQGLNVYIKNLDETIDDERLRAMFAEFGTVTSAKVMVNEAGVSRGFGFVCFSAQEEAARAITTMNGRLLGTKPLYVALAQRKEERAAQLEQHRQAFRQAGAPMGAPGMAPGPAPMMPMFYGQMQGAQNFVYPGMMPPGPRRWQNGQQGYPQIPYGQMNQRRRPGRGGGPVKEGRYMGAAPRGGARQAFRGMPAAGMPGPQRMMPKEGMMVPGPQPDMASLAALSADAPEIQKRRLGDALYPRVAQMRPQDAPKITGMLLEMDPAEIILLLENDDRLVEVVSEAARLLESHAQSMRKQEDAPAGEEPVPDVAAPEPEAAVVKDEEPSGEEPASTE